MKKLQNDDRNRETHKCSINVTLEKYEIDQF